MTGLGVGQIALVILPLLGAALIGFIIVLNRRTERTLQRILDALEAEAERAIKLVEYRHGEDR